MMAFTVVLHLGFKISICAFTSLKWQDFFLEHHLGKVINCKRATAGTLIPLAEVLTPFADSADFTSLPAALEAGRGDEPSARSWLVEARQPDRTFGFQRGMHTTCASDPNGYSGPVLVRRKREVCVLEHLRSKAFQQS